MQKREILVAFTGGTPWALGNIWRITAKKTDFYLDPLSEHEALRLSVHGPNEAHPDGHRFHVRVDRKSVIAYRDAGHFLIHSIPRKGYAFDGEQLAPGAFRVARIRWSWQLQRRRFRRAAHSGPGPAGFAPHQSGAKLSKELEPNEAADLDLVVSYGKPYWPEGVASVRDNARLGPLRNAAGLWLTATSYRRSQMKYPTPEGLVVPLPKPDEAPNRIMGGGPGSARSDDMYWFVESITSRDLVATPPAADSAGTS